MAYEFVHFDINGAIHPENELDVVVTEDINIVAVYEEIEMVDIKFTNTEGSEPRTIVVNRIVAEEVIIPVGGEVIVSYDPAKDSIEV